MVRYEFAVEGMKCGGCEAKLNALVEEKVGVTAVVASHEKGQVALDADPGVKVMDLKKAIESKGFKVTKFQKANL